MKNASASNQSWLAGWMQGHGVELWGMADLRDFATPENADGQRIRFAVCWAIPMNPHIMAGIQMGLNRAYAAEYARVNNLINISGKAHWHVACSGFATTVCNR